jgi:hypothetical protein
MTGVSPWHPAEMSLFFFLFLLLFICAYKAWFISLPCPHPLPYHPLRPLSPPPQYPAETILPLFLILCRESISNNRKEQGFLLVEIRIAIQGIVEIVHQVKFKVPFGSTEMKSV